MQERSRPTIDVEAEYPLLFTTLRYMTRSAVWMLLSLLMAAVLVILSLVAVPFAWALAAAWAWYTGTTALASDTPFWCAYSIVVAAMIGVPAISARRKRLRGVQ